MKHSNKTRTPSFWVFIFFVNLLLSACVKKEGSNNNGPELPEDFATGAVQSTREEIQNGVPFSKVAPEVFGNRSLASLPRRHELFMVEPGDQKQFESCVGWAVGYAAFSHHIKRLQKNSSYVESNTMSPTFIWNSLNDRKNHGITMSSALRFMIENGTCRYETMPFQNTSDKLPDDVQKAEAKNYRIDDYVYFETPNLDSLKMHLAVTKQPLVFLAKINDDFKRTKDGKSFKTVEEGRLVYTAADVNSSSVHAMTLCGYDDDIRAFKVLNSWGKSWGNFGYIWIQYDVFLSMLCQSGGQPEIYALWTMGPGDINRDLLAYYPLNNHLFDMSGNRKHAMSNQSFLFEEGRKEVAAVLKGKCTTGFCEGEEGGHILLPDLGLAGRKKFTINMWVNETRMELHDGEAYIFFGNHETGMIEISHLSDRLYFSVSRTNSFSVPFDYGDIGKFVMYSLVYDDGVMRAYRNATLLGESTGSVQVTDTTAAIGRHWWWSTSTRFTGAIDEVKIFGSALSSAQLKGLYDNP